MKGCVPSLLVLAAFLFFFMVFGRWLIRLGFLFLALALHFALPMAFLLLAVAVIIVLLRNRVKL